MNYFNSNGGYGSRLNSINQAYGIPTQPIMQPTPTGIQPQGFQQAQLQPQYPVNNVQYNNGVIPVGSIEEVKAYPLDFGGSITYFTDIANNKIYTKQLGLNGAPEIKKYSLDNSPIFNTDLGIGDIGDLTSINKRIESLESRITKFDNLLGGINNEYNANVPSDDNRKNQSTTNDGNA